MRRYQDVAVRTAYLVCPEADADDAVQDAFLKAYAALPRFRAGRRSGRGCCGSSPTRRATGVARPGGAQGLALRAAAADGAGRRDAPSRARGGGDGRRDARRAAGRPATPRATTTARSSARASSSTCPRPRRPRRSGCRAGPSSRGLRGRWRACARPSRPRRRRDERPADAARLPRRCRARASLRATADRSPGRARARPGRRTSRSACGPVSWLPHHAQPRRRASLAASAARPVLALVALLALAAIAGAVGLGLPGLRLILGVQPASPPPTRPPARRTPARRSGSGLGSASRDPRRGRGADRYAGPAPDRPRHRPAGRGLCRLGRAANQVAFVWAASETLPETREPGIGLILMRFEGTVDDGYRQKLLGEGVTVEPVTVDGGAGTGSRATHTSSSTSARTAGRSMTAAAGSATRSPGRTATRRTGWRAPWDGTRRSTSPSRWSSREPTRPGRCIPDHAALRQPSLDQPTLDPPGQRQLPVWRSRSWPLRARPSAPRAASPAPARRRRLHRAGETTDRPAAPTPAVAAGARDAWLVVGRPGEDGLHGSAGKLGRGAHRAAGRRPGRHLGSPRRR